MPETRNLGIDRSLGLGIDTRSITFKDMAREKKRQEAIADRSASATDHSKPGREALRKKSEAWSNKHEREDLKVARRDRRKRRMDAKRVALMTPEQLNDKRQLDELLAKVRQQTQDAAEVVADLGADFQGFDD
jgi:ATP-dependent RNA helicase DDX55/SPB4